IVLLACGATLSTSAAASAPILDSEKIAVTATIGAHAVENLPVSCPANKFLLSAVATPHDERSVRVLANQGLMSNGSVVPFIDGVYAPSVGTRVTAQNASDVD